MTDIIFAVIDNHKKSKKIHYDCLYKTQSYEDFKKFIAEKGLK